ncbi:MAG: protein kinase [Deltaproteobacteria bacterium]|nr:protein kinase [Deltaproteobacteria bacterium]
MPLALDSNDLPQIFGQYTLLRRIAVGGMAEVYVAKTGGVAGFEKLVALKVIHPRFSEDEHFTQMLVEEAKIAVLLTHVNIAQTFDLGMIDDTYYIAMELIEGADAYRVMRRCAELKKAIPIDVATFIVAEMCNGLDYAHRKRDPNTGQPLNIVHRDISPQNVLVSGAGEVKIVDFGIAKAASRSNQTEVGVIKGKYYYMSPEQAWGDPMDHRSDVFSTGVVLYELLTGRMLYQDADVPTLLDKVRKAEIPRPETRRPSIPRALSDIVMKALQKRPEDRWSSATEMGQALHQFLYSVSPTFSAARLADLIGLLFPAESGRGGGSAPNLDVLPPQEPVPPPKPAFDLGDDDEDDATRNDVLPFKRKAQAPVVVAPTPRIEASTQRGGPVDEPTSRESPAFVARAVAQANANVGARATVRPPGRSEATREIDSVDGRVSVPMVGPSGAWVAPITSDPGVVKRELTTDARAVPPSAWEDETDLRGNEHEEGDDFEDSTLVDANLGRAAARALAEPQTSKVESPRGRVHVAGTRELPIKSTFGDDHEDTTNELKKGLPNLAAVVPPRQQPAVALPAPRAKLSDRPPPRPIPGRPAAPAVPAARPQPPPSTGLEGATTPFAPAYTPQPPQQQAKPSQPMPPHQAAHQTAQPQAYPPAQQGYAPAQQGYSQASGQQGYAQSAPQQPYVQPRGQPSYPTQQPQYAQQQGYPQAQQGYSQGAQGYAQPPMDPYGTYPAQQPQQPYAPSPPNGVGRSTLDPFAPPPNVTGGLAAVQEAPRPFPWLLLIAGLLVLAVLAGVGVYAFVPSPTPAFEISSLPPGATVTIDGAVAGTTPLAIRDRLVVGQTYTFQVALEGHGTSAFELRAVPGTDRREIVLSPLQAVLHVETLPTGAQVTVGGASRGAAPVDVGGLFVGAEVDVRVDAPGHHPRTVHVRIPAAAHTETITLEPIR